MALGLVMIAASLAIPAVEAEHDSSADGEEITDALVEDVLDVAEQQLGALDEALSVARAAVENRRSLAGPFLANGTNSSLALGLWDLNASEDILAVLSGNQSIFNATEDIVSIWETHDIVDRRQPDLVGSEVQIIDAARRVLAVRDGGLRGAILAALEASESQAARIGVPEGIQPPDLGYLDPSDAAYALLQEYDVTPTTDQQLAISSLDAQIDPLKSSLTGFLEAFHAYVLASEAAYADADTEQLTRSPDLTPFLAEGTPFAVGVVNVSQVPEGDPGQILTAAGVSLADMLVARADVLHATLALKEALDLVDPVGALPLRAEPAICVDLTASDDTYDADCAVLVDAGGNDRYRNNAGGSGVFGGDCLGVVRGAAAALVDLEGDDDYSSDRSCGVRGGGYLGAGILVDAEGNDVYNRTGSGEPEVGQVSGAGILSVFDASSGEAARPSILRAALVDSGMVVSLRSATTTLASPGWRSHGIEETTITKGGTPHASATADVEAPSDAPPDAIDVGEPRPALSPNDPLFSEQYGPQAVRAVEAWDTPLGDSEASICSVDSGVEVDHEDLGSARYLGGYDFVHDDETPEDEWGTGTAVTAVASAGLNNGIGMAGLGNTGFFAAKVVDSSGLVLLSDVADAIEWCADRGAKVILVTIAAGDNPLVADAVAYAWNEGALLIAPAGDTYCFDCVQYPAAYPDVMAVGCTNETSLRCYFTSWGPEIELVAPGENILTAYLGDFLGYGPYSPHWSWTGISAAHVAGVAALLWSVEPSLTNAEVRQILRLSARDLGISGCDEEYGWGLLDSREALDMVLAGERPMLTSSYCVIGGFGANGGSAGGGLGMLIDGAGTDSYATGPGGVNGGAYTGLAVLVDKDGDDQYAGLERGVNGGGVQGAGFLYDAAGSDSFSALGWGANGGGALVGTGILLDRGGNDVLTASCCGVNGGGILVGLWSLGGHHRKRRP